MLLAGCQEAVRNSTPRTMLLYVTVDWEGQSLDNKNIEVMQQFRQKFPRIPMLQLINPAYFVKSHGHEKRLSQVIQSTFLPADTQGLHVHAWKSLMQYCGIQYQHHYSFANIDEDCKTGDCGYTVSLEYAYSEDELTKLIDCSKDILVENGFDRPMHFRAGGWQLGPKLIAALEANDFVWDSSIIDADLLTTRWHKQSGIIQMLRQLHPDATPLDQPYALTKTLTEYPNNAALADYTTSKQILTLFNNLIAANKKVMVLGFHQETASDFLIHLEQAISQMETIAKANNIELKWLSK
ncbi:MAG: hypothetical protein ACSHWN_03835 [Methylophilaceae bacterium]